MSSPHSRQDTTASRAADKSWPISPGFLYTPAAMPAAIGEPIVARIIVSLFNKYIFNGRWRFQCCCVPEEIPEKEELQSNSSGSCPASEAGAIKADLAYNHVHVDGG